jgi:hypothetical protein
MRDTIRKSANRYGRKGRPRFQSCTQQRRYVVKHGTFNMATGASEMTSQEWVTGPCNAPLFGDEAQTRGTCRSCFNGWTHPENYPV